MGCSDQIMIITVDGCMGVGKTTFCNNLQQYLQSQGIDCQVFEENIDPQALELYLADKSKALEFQSSVLMSKYKTMKLVETLNWINSAVWYIVDRSMYGDWIFAKQNIKSGFDQYDTMFDSLDECKCDISILLAASPEVCLNRISHRGIVCEQTYTKQYVQTICQEHESFNYDLVLDWDTPDSMQRVVQLISII